MFTWEKLLCTDTLAEKEKAPASWDDYPVDPFEQDYREIISSKNFRSLQDKTQVYQWSKGESVRTRLTHSLEVSTVAKQLGTMLIYNKKWNTIRTFSSLTIDQARAIPTILACSGLLHDMGNPPFGHTAEHAIGEWFKKKLEQDDFAFFGTPIRELFTEQMCADLRIFEGNAQLIRVLSKCRFGYGKKDANLTFATISSLIKYPVSSVMNDPDNEDLRLHKMGFYLSEEKIARYIREKTGVALPGQPYARNPLTYLLEASDDIAYINSDIEDAIFKGAITPYQLMLFLKREFEKLPQDGDEKEQMQLLTTQGIIVNLEKRLNECDSRDDEREAVLAWTAYLRNWLMYVAAKSFVDNSEAIMNGTYKGDLLEGSMHRFTIQLMRREMRKNVYPLISDMEVAADRIITDFLNRFVSSVIYWETEKPISYKDRLYINIIPNTLKEQYKLERTGDRVYDLYLRFRMVTDYISSMSDEYALALYKRFNAISF